MSDKTNCCVVGCTTRKGKNPELAFHRFPQENKSFVSITNKEGNKEKMDRKKAWILAIRTGKKVSERMRVCSLHFTVEDYILPEYCIRKRLRNTAVPSQNLPVLSHETRTNLRKPPTTLSECSSSASSSVSTSSVASNTTPSSPTTQQFKEEEHAQYSETSGGEALVQLLETRGIPKILKKDIAIQVGSGDFSVTYSSTIATVKQLKSLTGLPSFELLKCLVDFCEEFLNEFCNKHLISVKDAIIFTFIKLKLGLKHDILSILFNIDKKSCQRIFHETLAVLAGILGTIIRWPSRDEISRNMPRTFQDFQNVRVVLDCIEIPLQRLKCLCCRLRSYSINKKQNTAKFMLGLAPSGLITFVSKGYGGRCLDSDIFKQSKILDKLDVSVDCIMVDKGSTIKDVAAEHGITIIQPKEFSEEEDLLTVKIARARVHIERISQRIKTFQILKRPVPHSLLSQIDNILVIVCAIINLSSPVLSDEEFL